MRIAHVTDYYLPRLGGIEMQVHDLAVRQRAAGHETTVITQTPQDLGSGTSDPDPVWVERVPSPVAQRAIRPFLTGFTAPDWLTPDRFDLIHVHASLISPFAMLAGRAAAQAGIPTVVTVHSLWSRTGPSPNIAWGIVGHQSWPVIWSAVSRAAAGPVSKTLGGAAVAVLPNGIDPETWQTTAAPRTPGTVTIASVMRLSRRKRPMPLLAMLRRLREMVPAEIGLHAVIIGDGPLRATMIDYLKAHDMDGWVSLPGRLERPDIRLLFSRSDLYVAPAELESFGIAALEARSAGLPVIASRHGGVGEFIADGAEGFLAGSDDEMLHALAALVADDHTRDAIAVHNRAMPPSVGWQSVLDRADVLYAAAQLRVTGEARRRAGAPRRLRAGVTRTAGGTRSGR
ncbi:MAG: glycosyltransferase family 4 protein [Nocardioidaceae bacterium]